MNASRQSYANSELSQLLRQAIYGLRLLTTMDEEVALLLGRLKRDEQRMEAQRGAPLRGLDLLEIGPGQHCERARYFGLHNHVTAVDLDRIPASGGVNEYLTMLRTNGLGRVAKTAGRKLLQVDRARRDAWLRALNRRTLRDPTLIQANVCSDPLPRARFDAVMSWSVFEHLPDPERALDNVIGALRPGGVLYIGVHLYTSNTGHHDIRAFTGGEHLLPVWGHLRPSAAHCIRPSAFLNKLRLRDWRELFTRKAPGHVEFRDDHGANELRKRLSPELRRELSEYDDEELFSVDVFYSWRKPSTVLVSAEDAACSALRTLRI